MTPTTPVPATLPNVVRRGTPLRWHGADYTALGPVSEGGYVWVGSCDRDAGGTIPASACTIDLTDATGRAHVAWSLGGVGASWHLDCEGYRRWCLHGGEEPRRGASQAWEGIGAEQRAMRGDSVDLDATDVPTLDSLDPDDDTRLPDGSRWVDSEALARVALHVLGLPPLVEAPDAE